MDALCWQVEHACLNAWPSPRHALVHGYLLRSAGGPSRRINSCNPLRGAGEPDLAISASEALFAGLGRQPIFRVPDIAAQMAAPLERRGYRAIGETRVLFRDLDDLPACEPEAATLTAAPTEEWLALRDRMSGNDAEAAGTFRAVTDAIILPRAFASLTVGGQTAAIGFGVRDGDLLVIESVAVDPACRRRGLAGQAVASLLHWARSEGATGVCLQVEAENAPANSLYRRLGFERELYRYHYRVRD